MMKFCPECGSNLTSRSIDDVNRLVCSNAGCHFIYWNNPVPVVAALVKNNEHYIIAHNKAWPKGIYSLITGYLEQNETPEQAVIRETREELGLDAEIIRYIGHYSFFKKNQLILCYELTASGTVTLNHELSDWKSLTPEQLTEYDFRPLSITQQIIRDWREQNKIDPVT